MYTLIYFLSFYDLEVQKRRRPNDVDIINCQEKKEVGMAGLRKGRGKEFGCTRARACEGEMNKVFSPSPHATENPFPFQKTAMQAKEKTVTVWDY